MSRPIVTVVYAEITAPVVRAQTPPLLRVWRESGRRVDAAVFTSPRALVMPGTRAAHRAALLSVQEAIGREPWTRTHLPRDVGLRSLGASLADARRRIARDGTGGRITTGDQQHGKEQERSHQSHARPIPSRNGQGIITRKMSRAMR